MNYLNHAKDTLNLGPLKTNSFGDRYLYQLNRGSFDRVSAQAIYETEYTSSLFAVDTLTIIIGTDSGLLPLYIYHKGIPDGARYIFIEPHDILTQLIDHQLITQLPPEISCVSPNNWEEQAKNFKIADYFYINAVRSLNSICAQEGNHEAYSELSWHITEKLTQGHWGYNINLGREGFIVSQMRNLADNLMPASILKNTFKEKTAMVLAGGPSLDEALPWVKQHRDHITLFAVSRIARQLQLASIAPDFICSVDPNEFSFDISKEMLLLHEKTIFIYAYHTVPKLVHQWPGKKLYLGPRFPWKTSLNGQNIDSTGPTVTNTAISTAFAFGFNRIILAGVDLCFTRDGFTHAKGSDETLSGPRFNLTSLQVQTNKGETAPTSFDFLSAINTLAMQAKLYTQHGCQLINSAANAAKVEHIDYLALTDIVLPENLKAFTRSKIAILDQAQQQLPNIPGVLLKELQQAEYQIRAISHLAEDAIRINNAMYNTRGIIENYTEKRKLDKIEQRLKHQYRKFSVAVKNLGIRQFIKITKPFEDSEITAAEAKKLCHIYYTAYQEGATKFLELITDSKQRIQCRIEESKVQPNFQTLFRQWENDQSFGRAKIRQNAFNLPISSEIEVTLNHYTQQFEATIADKNTGHLARAKSFSSLVSFKNRARLLYKHGKINELRDLKAGLEKYPNQQEAFDYAHLANGYIADLENHIETALTFYQAIIDGETSSLYEDALMRIAQLCLRINDHQNSFYALQCLAQLSPAHLPMYAEINRVLGNSKAASEIYCEYLSQFPNDTIVQLKLASLHLENKAYAAADLLLDYILHNTPESTAALSLKTQVTTLINIAADSITKEIQLHTSQVHEY